MVLTQNIPKNLLWLDLEITGLDATSDRIIETAILTKFDLNEIARYVTGVKQEENFIKHSMFCQDFFKNRPAETDLETKNSLGGKPKNQVQQEIL